MARLVVTSIDALPRIDEEPGLDWRPLQHFAGLTAFGCNVFRAERAGVELVAEHDETGSGHEEVYVVLDGLVTFVLDGERHLCERGGIVALLDPAIRRAATAESDGAALLAISNRRAERYESTWHASHFEGVPTAGSGS
jgi:hypothetical protein